MDITQNQVLLLISGGVDSKACLHFYKTQAYNVKALFVDYGQTALSEELKAVKAITKEYDTELITCKFTSERVLSDGEVFGRNTFLLSCALLASSQLPKIISMGIHKGTQYFDCSEAYLKQINQHFQSITTNQVEVHAPFINFSKGDIFNYCKKEKINLDNTYSCELGQNPVCGKCLSCKDRKA